MVEDGGVVVVEVGCVQEQVGEVVSSCLHAGQVALRVLDGPLRGRAHVVTGVVSERYGGFGEAVVEAEHVGGRARFALDDRRGCCFGLVVRRCRTWGSLSCRARASRS